jgi:hypothetical protein
MTTIQAAVFYISSDDDNGVHYRVGGMVLMDGRPTLLLEPYERKAGVSGIFVPLSEAVRLEVVPYESDIPGIAQAGGRFGL